MIATKASLFPCIFYKKLAWHLFFVLSEIGVQIIAELRLYFLKTLCERFVDYEVMKGVNAIYHPSKIL